MIKGDLVQGEVHAAQVEAYCLALDTGRIIERKSVVVGKSQCPSREQRQTNCQTNSGEDPSVPRLTVLAAAGLTIANTVKTASKNRFMLTPPKIGITKLFRPQNYRHSERGHTNNVIDPTVQVIAIGDDSMTMLRNAAR